MKLNLPLKKVFFLLTFFLLIPSTSQAIDQIRLTAIPPRTEDLRLSPGESQQITLKIKNETQVELVIDVGAKDFIVQDAQGSITPLEGDIPENAARWSLASWLTLSEQQVLVAPNESYPVEVLINVPEDAVPGGHYAYVYYQPSTESLVGNSEGSAATVVQQVGSLIYLTVEGDIQEEAYVRRLKVPCFSEYGPISFLTEIDNLSDTHIRPQGNIQIKNIFGQLSTTLQLEEKNIFPYTSRIFENTWDKKWLFGRYQANLNAGYGDTGQALLATAFFWVIPWRLILALLLALLIVVLITLILRQRARQPTIVDKS